LLENKVKAKCIDKTKHKLRNVVLKEIAINIKRIMPIIISYEGMNQSKLINQKYRERKNK